MLKKFLEVINVTKVYSGTARGTVRVLAPCSLEVRQKEWVSIIGHSGCGKSTLLSMIAGLEPASSGSICFKELEIDGPGPERAVVFQNHSLLPWRTVLQNVQLAVDAVFAAKPRSERRDRAIHWLLKVGLGPHLHKYPHEISGGMKQRTGIARALAMEPELLLLDEPFGALDALTRSTLQDEVLKLQADTGVAVISVTHDVDEAVSCSDRIVMMNTGPDATIGQILAVDEPRPRDRAAFMLSPRFAELRNECMKFLFWKKTG